MSKVPAWPIAALLCLMAAGPAAAYQEEAPDGAIAAAPSPRAVIREARAIQQPRGVEELREVEIGGIKQWISIRGRDRRNPILLFIHGGPASAEMPASWLYQSPWEDYFTVVQWDQRGAGKTAAANDPALVTPTITIEQMTADGEELVALLRETFSKDKIFVLGHSWGTVIGLSIAQRHPEWLHAYIGMGQVINGQENERIGYAFAQGEARRREDAQALSELAAIAPYPAADGAVTFEQILAQRKWVIGYGGLTWGRSDFTYEQNARLLSPEYTDADLAADQYVGASLVQLLPGLTRLDFGDVRRLDCPIFLFNGRHDYATPSSISAAWLETVSAPQKQIFWFEHSAHMMQFEQPGKVFMHLVRDIRPIAERAGDVAPEDKPGVGE